MGIWRTQVRSTFPIGSKHGVNTWHIRTQDLGDNSQTIQDLMDQVGGFYYAVAAKVPGSGHFTWDGTAVEVGTEDPEAVGGFTPFDVAGRSGTGNWGPAPAMACVTWRSAKASRRGRGRTFLGPFSPDAFGTDGSLDDGFRTDLLEAAADLITFSAANGNGAIGVYSQVDLLLRDYVSASITDQAAVLKSRRG